jgi:hypothetical protein
LHTGGVYTIFTLLAHLFFPLFRPRRYAFPEFQSQKSFDGRRLGRAARPVVVLEVTMDALYVIGMVSAALIFVYVCFR